MNTKLIDEVAVKNSVDITITYCSKLKWDIWFFDIKSKKVIDFKISIKSEIEVMEIVDRFDVNDYEQIDFLDMAYSKKSPQQLAST